MALKLEHISLQDIFDYIENGKPETAPTEIVRYLDLLEKSRAMHLRIDKFGSKEMVVKHLVKVEGLSPFLASQIYNDALEYFYADTQVSKSAWRNIIAEKLAKVANMAMITAKTVQDWKYVANILMEEFKARQLDQPDVEDLPSALFEKPFKLYTQSAEALGLPAINRMELARFIDELPELTEKEKEVLKREASILPNKLFPDEQEDARK